MLDQTERDLFWLAVLLIIVAYFVGFATDAQTVFAGVNSLGLTFTGRNQAGEFAAYPQAA